jgi:hypothetical protein
MKYKWPDRWQCNLIIMVVFGIQTILFCVVSHSYYSRVSAFPVVASRPFERIPAPVSEPVAITRVGDVWTWPDYSLHIHSTGDLDCDCHIGLLDYGLLQASDDPALMEYVYWFRTGPSECVVIDVGP